MVRRECMAQLVVVQKQDTDRLAAQGDRYAQDRARVERSVLTALELHRPHVWLGGCHHVLADVSAEPEGQLLGRLRVGAEATLQDQPARFLQGEAADRGG